MKNCFALARPLSFASEIIRQEFPWRENVDAFKKGERPDVLQVPCHQHIGACFQGAFQDAVVRLILLDHRDPGDGLNDRRKPPDFFDQYACFIGIEPELQQIPR